MIIVGDPAIAQCLGALMRILFQASKLSRQGQLTLLRILLDLDLTH